MEPILFREVVIVTYIGCFEAILCWESILDCGITYSNYCMIVPLSVAPFVPGCQNPGSFHKDSANYPENEGLHIALLCRVFKIFPRLTGISTTMSFGEDPDEVPWYFRSNPDLNEVSRTACSISHSHENTVCKTVLCPAMFADSVRIYELFFWQRMPY